MDVLTHDILALIEKRWGAVYMRTDSQASSGWRNNWFIKYVVAEIPIIGSFVTAKTLYQGFHQSGKSAAMLVGGTAAMALDMIPSNEQDSMTLKMTKMTANMAVGMTVANSLYNGLWNGGEMLYQYCVHRNSIPLVPPSERTDRELLPTSAPRNDPGTL